MARIHVNLLDIYQFLSGRRTIPDLLFIFWALLPISQSRWKPCFFTAPAVTLFITAFTSPALALFSAILSRQRQLQRVESPTKILCLFQLQMYPKSLAILCWKVFLGWPIFFSCCPMKVLLYIFVLIGWWNILSVCGNFRTIMTCFYFFLVFYLWRSATSASNIVRILTEYVISCEFFLDVTDHFSRF